MHRSLCDLSIPILKRRFCYNVVAVRTWISHYSQAQIQGSWDQHWAHLGPTGPRWAPCWPHEACYLGELHEDVITYQTAKIKVDFVYYCTTHLWLLLLKRTTEMIFVQLATLELYVKTGFRIRLYMYWRITSQNWHPYYKYGWTLIPAWISNYIHYKVWDELHIPKLQRHNRWRLRMNK